MKTTPGPPYPRRLTKAALLIMVGAVTSACEASAPSSVDRELQALIEQAPPEQQAALADGSVSRAEYDAAARAFENCIGDEGWDVRLEWEEPARQGLAGSWSTVVVGPDEQALARFEDDMAECGDRHTWPLGRVYSLENTDPRVLEEHIADVRESAGQEVVMVSDPGPGDE